MKVQVNREALREFCQQRGIARLELFGSALGEDFREDSDVDLLCSLRPDLKCGLFEWVAIKLDLEKLFGRPVDLVSRWGIEHSRNPYRKHAILSTVVPLYDEVNLNVVWDAAMDSLPPLISQLESYLAAHPPPESAGPPADV